jgi:glycosyltransferase involved in cell wall biosynthesis
MCRTKLIEFNRAASHRVMYLENGLGFGGAVISLRTFLQHADTDRFAPLVIHSLNDERFQSFDGLGQRFFASPISFGSNIFGYVARRLNLDVLEYAWRLRRLILENSVDLVYLNNDIFSNLAGIIAAKASGVPSILHERGIPHARSGLAQLVAKWPNRYLAISGAVRSALLRYGVLPESIRMVPEGLDLSLYKLLDQTALTAVRRSIGIDDEHVPLVVMAGMVMPWKGQHVLLAAAREVLKTTPNARFVIVGEAPSGAERYAKELAGMRFGYSVEDAVTFVGYRDDIPAVMQAADVVVHASTSPEPFGRVVIEGMVMEAVVIATAIGAPPEIIEDGVSGFLVPPSDPHALAEKIVVTLRDDALRKRIGRRAREVVIERYAISRHVGLIEAVFEEVLGTATNEPAMENKS